MKLEHPIDEPLASQFLLLWLDLSCDDHHHDHDGDDQEDDDFDDDGRDDDHDDDCDVNLHDDIEALRCFGLLNSIDF